MGSKESDVCSSQHPCSCLKNMDRCTVVGSLRPKSREQVAESRMVFLISKHVFFLI